MDICGSGRYFQLRQMDQTNSDLILDMEAPYPTPPAATNTADSDLDSSNPISPAQANPDFNSDSDASNSIPPAPNVEHGGPSQNPVNTAYTPLFNVVRSGDLDATEKFLKDHPEAVKAKITFLGETALHIATMFGHLNIVEKLVESMTVEDLELMDNLHNTALQCAVFNTTKNAIKAAKCMIEKNKRLATIPSQNGWIPITLALDYGHIEMGRYLYSVTPFEALLPENGHHGALFLTQCCIYKIFDIALVLIRRCPTLVVTTKDFGESNFWFALATAPSAFQSKTQLSFWKRWLHNWFEHRQPAFSINERTCDHYDSGISRGFLHQFVWNILNFLGIKKIYEASLAHKQYHEVLRAACNAIPTLNQEEMPRYGIPLALTIAAKRGNPEFIVEAVKMNLPLLWIVDVDKRRIFHLAVRFRQVEVFNLIHGLVLKHVMANSMDKDSNSLLHMAGFLAPPKQLNHISGALLQMQRELQWFKEVESVMPPMKKEILNRDNLTARELFTKEHKDLVKEGEKWTKGTASSCSVVAALVVTITFAVAFTVPGGNDQTTGYPIFLRKKLFMVFSISNAVSLFSSSTSLLMFLGLLTSRYAEDDFLTSLPKKLIIGLSAMFISIATMMIAFCAALFLMLQNQYSWIVIPVTVLASIPVTLYIWLQFPLLVEIFTSTYGPGIFDRNVKPWP